MVEEKRGSFLYLSRIENAYDHLTNSEKKIADYILENFEEISMKSTAELAKLTGSSTATLFRFCKSIGFSGITEFKMSMKREYLTPESNYINIQKSDSVAVIKQKALLFDKYVVQGMMTSLDEDKVAKAANMITKANHMIIIGDGGSGCSARNAFDVFMQLGIQCEYLSDPFFEITRISQLNEKDVVFAFTNSGRSMNTIENTKQAKKVGAATLGLVGIPGTPISKYLDIELYTSVSNHKYFCDTIAARICELSILSVLYSLILVEAGKKITFSNNKNSEILDIKRYKNKAKV